MTGVQTFSIPAADLTLRPALPADAVFVTDLFTDLHPDDPQDPVVWRHAWEHPDPDRVFDRWIAERGGRQAGYAAYQHVPWERMPERWAHIQGDVAPDLRTLERLVALVGAMEVRAVADGALRFSAWAWEWDELRIGALQGHGYKEERRERFWELDLVANRERLERMAAESRRRMRDEGITLTTIDRVSDPEKWRKLHRTSDEADQDVPSTVPHTPSSLESFMQWFSYPSIHHDRVWVALLDGDIVGVSALAYPPVRGIVSTDWTATARKVRGRGVARALKAETVMQAIALGVDRVRTDNDSTNAPILHINETMGYKPRPEAVQLIKQA